MDNTIVAPFFDSQCSTGVYQWFQSVSIESGKSHDEDGNAGRPV